MKENEVFDMFQRIDAKLDTMYKTCMERQKDCSDCRVDDLNTVKSILDQKADTSFVRWMAGGIATAIAFLALYSFTLRSDITRIQTNMEHYHQDNIQKGVKD
jgi:hypothetical protein